MTVPLDSDDPGVVPRPPLCECPGGPDSGQSSCDQLVSTTVVIDAVAVPVCDDCRHTCLANLLPSS